MNTEQQQVTGEGNAPRVNATTMSTVRNRLKSNRSDLVDLLDISEIPFTRTRRLGIARAIVQIEYAIKNLE